jgi:hypothetical protein
MSGKVKRGVSWLKSVMLLWSAFVGFKILFAFGQENTARGVVEAVLLFIGGFVITGIPAFILGWVTGKDKPSISGAASMPTTTATLGSTANVTPMGNTRTRVGDETADVQALSEIHTGQTGNGTATYCVKCGGGLPSEANFCASCGTKTAAAAPSKPDAKELAPTAAASVATPTLPSERSRGTPFQITDTHLGVVKPILPSQRLRVLQHSVAVMLACLAVPSIWKSPNFEYAVALWSVYPALSLGLAGLITGIAFVFYPQKMNSIWPDVFIKTAWGVTGVSLFGAYLALSSQ